MVIWLINNITLIIDTMSLFMPEIMYRCARVYFINKLLNSRILDYAKHSGLKHSPTNLATNYPRDMSKYV